MAEHNQSWTLTARWIIPIAGVPLENGILHIEGERIASVEPKGWTSADVDLGNVAVLPGFVNAHTHLDLTGLEGKCPPTPRFTDWLRCVIEHRRQQTPEQVEADIRKGLALSIRHGTTLLGDISAGGASWPILASSPIRSVVYLELIGLKQERAEEAWQQAQEWLRTHERTPTCRPGVSPHAPYSVRKDLFKNIATLPSKVPVAIHVAETRHELQLLKRKEGPFVKFLKELGAWDRKGLVTSIEQIFRIIGKHNPTIVHGNYLESLRHLHVPNIVYCPRTHAAFGHSDYPWRSLMDRLAYIALGTDSLASNPGLDILGEIRFLYRKHRNTSPDKFFEWATSGGARALGWENETGILMPGLSADLVVIPLPDWEYPDPYELVAVSDQPVQKVMCRGKWIGEFDSSASVN